MSILQSLVGWSLQSGWDSTSRVIAEVVAGLPFLISIQPYQISILALEGVDAVSYDGAPCSGRRWANSTFLITVDSRLGVNRDAQSRPAAIFGLVARSSN